MIVGDVGGGFGMKTSLYPEDVVVAFAARALRRPVRFTAERIEEFLAREPWSRRDRATRRAGARRRRPHPRAARRVARQRRRLRDAGRCGHPASDRAVGIDEHLRHRDDRHRHQGGAHAHAADRSVSRRRPARGDLHHRAADGRRGAQDRHRPHRAAPAQHDPSGADAVHECDGQDVRQRPVREGDGSGARAAPTGKVSPPAPPTRSAAAGCAGRASRRSSNGPAPTCSRKRSTSPSTATGAIEIFTAAQPMGQSLATTFTQLAVDVFGVPRESHRHALRRHRSRDGLRQRRLAVAVRRRLGRARRVRAHASTKAHDLAAQAARSGDRPTSNTATACSALPAPTGSIGLFELARQQAGRAHRPAIDQLGRSLRAGPTAATSAKSKSIRTRATSSSTATGRSTTSAASSTRWS